jgi:uncharacterized protein YraI
MLRIGIWILSFTALWILVGGAAQAQTYTVQQDVSDGILNMRDGPGTGHRLIVSIAAGSGGISVGECRNPDDGTSRFTWCHASWMGYSGWISSCCIKAEGNEGNEVIRQGDLRRHGIDWPILSGNPPGLPVGCPYQGEGWTLSFSREFYQSYLQRGFSLKAMCLALASESVRFDPETGKKIKCYRIVGWESGGCYPFFAPDCFRTVQLISGDNTAEQAWRPTGCPVRYDPSTGKVVRNVSEVKLFTGGGAGDAPDESSQTRASVDDARLGRLLSGP